MKDIVAVPASTILRSLTPDSAVWYCEMLVLVLVVHLARVPPGVLAPDCEGGSASSAQAAMSVDELLGVKVPVGGAQLGSRERVCVCLRRAVSLLRLHLSVTVALLNVLYEGEPPPAVTKPFRRAMSLLAEALRAKVAHVEAWRRHPSAVNAPGGVFVTTKLLRPLFADLCALATECLPLVPLLCGTQFVRTVDTLRGVLSATCDGEPIKPSDDRPATVLDRDVSGKRLAHLWQRLLQLDGSMLPQWQALLAAGST